MIDLNLLRENPERLSAELKKRFIEGVDLSEIRELDERRRKAVTALEELRAQHRVESGKIAKATINKRKSLIDTARALAGKIKKQEPAVEKLELQFKEKIASLPNLSHSTVPQGNSAANNQVDSVVGEKPLFDFEPKPHWLLAGQLGLIDSKRASRLSGARFNYIKGDLVRLQFALLRFVLDELLQRAFTPMLTPVLVKEEAMYGAGMFPLDRQEVYGLADDQLYLTGTSEIALLSYHAHETLSLARGPLRYTGYSTNFRREAGAYGKDTRGLIRQHQFDKLEMFVFVSQEQSWDVFENELVGIAEGILKKLGLHYRRVILCSADLPRKFQKTYDLETWLPSEKRYLETHSISHAGDFQARRLGIKYVAANGQRRYAHTLNATACAFSRMPVVIMEQYQQGDGRIRIPEVLQPYMNNQEWLGGSSTFC
ncbi:MAG: serine--tRNA ligase [Parcubacteria group bacterium]